MTQDEIIEMAREVQKDCVFSEDGYRIWSYESLGRLIKLAAAKEREECAEIAEKQRYAMFISLTSHPAQNGTAVGIAKAIRARGQA